MSRPRRPFGVDQPGRLQATMLKVLAAEMSDPGRLARGKRLRAEDAVVDLVIGHGAVTAVVQGSRPDPYVVTVLTRAGHSVPARRDVTIRCTCPDDGGGGAGDACKHGVAAMFAFADEVSMDIEALARWRQSDTVDGGDAGDEDGDEDGEHAGDDADDADEADGDDGDEPAGRTRRLVAVPPPVDPLVDELAGLLRAPDGERLPPLPVVTPLEVPPIADRLVADVVDDALAHLRGRWD